jgi:hypothetical protein
MWNAPPRIVTGPRYRARSLEGLAHRQVPERISGPMLGQRTAQPCIALYGILKPMKNTKTKGAAGTVRRITAEIVTTNPASSGYAVQPK